MQVMPLEDLKFSNATDGERDAVCKLPALQIV